MTAPVRSIHPTRDAAERERRYTLARDGIPCRVEYGVRGTTPDRPWGVVADRKAGRDG